MQVCSSKDKKPIIGEMSFYGVIEEIWELNYNSFKVVIFKCDWVENSGGIKTDKLGFVLVDLSRVGHKNDYFILATQAKQVFFDEILDKSPNDESPNDALSQALDTLEYGGRVRGMGGFIAPTIYFHQAKPRKSNKVDTTQQIIDENEALCKRIRELEQKVQNIPTSKHGSCSKSKVQENMVVVSKRVLENVVKEKKEIATSVRPTSLTSKKKVVKEDEVKEEEVIVTRPSISKNKVNVKLFGIPRKSYVLREDVIDFCNMQKVKTLSMVAYIMYLYSLIIDLKKFSKYVFIDPSLISAGFQCTVECGYYVMRYMREIVDRRNSYSQLELDEIQVE
ncbi:hypothetical protein IC575_004407 [Cucumis melo]